VNTTLDHNTLPTGAVVYTLGKRVEGEPEYEGQWWEIEFVVSPDGKSVEVWSRGFLPEADTIPYGASRPEWSPVPLRSHIPLEWGRDLWAGLARSGFSVIYPSYRKA
jgi:hypothetical protein